MRRLLVLVLCLLMPLQGFAALQVVAAAPCPMQGMMAADGGANDKAATEVDAMEDCCNDLATFERTGQPCKSAQSCGVLAAGMPVFQPPASQVSVTQAPLAPAWRSLSQGSPTSHWRPPASI